jgi:hypothetical protein
MPAASAVLSLLTFFGPCKESQSPVGAKPDGLDCFYSVKTNKIAGDRHLHCRGCLLEYKTVLCTQPLCQRALLLPTSKTSIKPDIGINIDGCRVTNQMNPVKIANNID